jgi:hypothetical protein
MIEHPSEKSLTLPIPVIKLILTWACSLLWGVGVFLSAWALIGAVVAGLLNFFGPPTWGVQGVILLVLGLVAIFSAPMFLGAFLSHSWRKGFTNGLFALLASIIGFFLFYQIAGFMYDLFSSHPEAFYSLISALPAGFAIATVMLINESPRRLLGIALGLTIGLCLALASAIIFGQNLFANNNVFHLLWQAPAFVWVSIVYWSELIGRQKGWSAFLIWALLILITFGLPFVIVRLISLK